MVTRRLAALAIFTSLLFLTVISVFPAQEAAKPPAWVGIYTTAGKVGLKWTAVRGAARYKVYRSITSGKGYEITATTTDVSFIDAGVKPGETYYYTLKTVYADDRESVYSEERYIKLPAAVSGLPVNPPEWVGVLLEDKQIRLAWVPSPSSNALAYNVYKSRQKDKGYQLIGSTQDPNLTDSDVKEGETYYYALTTLDKDFKETGFSEVKQVKYTLPKEAPSKAGPRGEEAYALPDKILAKPTRAIGYIVKGKDDLPLTSPTDIELDAAGNLYITDTGTSTIQIFKPDGKFLRKIGGRGKQQGKFEKLLGVHVDENGNVFAVDAYTGRIQKFDPEGRLIMSKGMAEDKKAIAKDLGLKVPPAAFGIVKLVTSSRGALYTVDNYNDCIEVYTANGRYVKAFGGKGLKDGQFQSPTFAVFAGEDNLYVADCLNARVQVFDRDGVFQWKFGSYGNVVGSFGRPKGIFVEDSGRIFVADSMLNVVQVFDKDGRFLFILGDEKGRQMDLCTPNGIVMDKKRRIYMVEKLINRVQIRQVGD